MTRMTGSTAGRLLRTACLCAATLGVPLALAGPGAAQTEAPAPPAAVASAPILTLDRDRLFTGTLFGRAVSSRFEGEATALQAENRRIDAALEAEERLLTERRGTMPPDEFRSLTDDFDSRVEGLRTAQETKARDLSRRRDEARQKFFEAAVPVLGELMTEQGAVAIIDRAALILSFDRIDVTDEAIARIDEVLGDGTGSASAAEPPAQDGAPETAPQTTPETAPDPESSGPPASEPGPAPPPAP